jgi:hypothetical protein
MKFKNEFYKFNRFISEEEDMSFFLKMRTKEEEEPVDKEKQKAVDKEREDHEKVCPRCGHKEGEGCKCNEKDFYSTVNAYRIPKGQMINIKEYSEFLKEDSEGSEFKHTYSLGMSWWKRWEKKNGSKYDIHHVKQELYYAVYSKDGVHLFTFNYDNDQVFTDEPKNFFEA